MNREQFLEALEELKSKNGDTDYRLDLRYKGVSYGVIYADGNLDDIEVDERYGYVLVYTNDIGMLVDDAEVLSI